MRLLHHLARPGVDQEHEAAQGEVEYAAGGGQPDADGVRAPAAGSEAGDRGRADHTVGLEVAVEEERHRELLERVPSVQALECSSRFSTSVVMKSSQGHVQGLRHGEVPLGDLLSALDHERRRAQHERQRRRPGEHPLRSTPGTAVGGRR